MNFRALFVIGLLLLQPLLSLGAAAGERAGSEASAATGHCASIAADTHSRDSTDSEDHLNCGDDCGRCTSCLTVMSDFSPTVVSLRADSYLVQVLRPPPIGVHSHLYRPPILF